MKRIIVSIATCLLLSLASWGQSTLSLDSCRALAIKNNKELRISEEKIKIAGYNKKEAFSKYLPAISATGTYMRNEKEISLLNDVQKSSIQNIGTTASNTLSQAMAGLITQHPELAGIIAQYPELGGIVNSIAPALNSVGTSITDAFRTDTRNMYGGIISLKQPIFMGGKIRAYNKITGYAKQLAEISHDSSVQDVVLATDQAYWQVVSLVNKKKLAESYLDLLKKMENDIDKMIETGIATKADGLSVKVKVNEAEMTLTQVEDGLTLSRMLLCQICGLPVDTQFSLADEETDSITETNMENISYDMEPTIENRPEIRQLTLATNIYDQKVKLARAEFMPSVALVGNYLFTNPALFNGFENKVRGMWNVGVIVNIPLCNWGGGIWKAKAAKSEALISRYQLEDAKEKVELQINQSSFKVNEAVKKLSMAQKNLDKAEENLRYATLGFEEGVIATNNTLEAHTAWMKANSELIDAKIDVKMTRLYLEKALGTLQYNK